MSGAVAAHASYNGSGTQGLAVTNKINDTSSGDVTSVYWNDNDTVRQLVYGSSTMEVPTSGSGKNASWGGSQIFTVNNDVDCVGDMYLSVTIDLNKPAASGDSTPHTMITDTGLDAYGRSVLKANRSPVSSFLANMSTDGVIPKVNGSITHVSFSAGANPVYFKHDGGDIWHIVGNIDPNYLWTMLKFEEVVALVDFYNGGDHSVASTPYGGAVTTQAEWVRPSGGRYLTIDTAIKLIQEKQRLEEIANNGLQAGRITQDYANLPSVGHSNAAIPWTALFESLPGDIVNLKNGVPTASGGTNDAAIFAAATPNGKWGDSDLKTTHRFPLAKVIKRIEFQVGTQIWQTLEYDDLIAINASEVAESSYNRLGLQTSGFVRNDGQRQPRGDPKWIPGTKYQAFIPLPMLTKSIGPHLENFTQQSEDGYLMAAAPHQNVKIKVTYNNFNDVFYTEGVTAKEVFSCSLGECTSDVPVPWTPSATLSTKLFAQHMIMCNEEREQMKNMPNGIPKRLKMTQNVNMQVPKLFPDQAVTVDLDHFSIYASHLIIGVKFQGSQKQAQDNMPTIKNAELKLNSSSFSGLLDGPLLKGITSKTLGLYANEFNIDKEHLEPGIGYYVFPLASKAFGGSSIPLNRFDNIRLLLTFHHESLPSSGGTMPGTINVTGVGETTGLYKAGAASLAMY